MPEEVDALAFSMPRESEAAFRLKSIISDMLPLFSDDYPDDILSEYITVLVCNGKNQRQAREDLEAFLGKQSSEFVACIWEILLNDFSQGKQENYAVDFDSPDTLTEQGLDDDYDHKATNAATPLNEKLVTVTAPTEELICAQPKGGEDWNSSGLQYSRKVLRSVIVSAIKQPCGGMNPDKHEKSMYESSGLVQKRIYLPEREMGQCHSQSVPSGRALSERSHDAASHQEMMPRVSVWDRLGRSRSNPVLDQKCVTLPNFGIQAHENKVLQQHESAFPAVYSEQQNKTFHNEAPAVGYRDGVFQSHKARKLKSGTITSTEPHISYNLSRKRRYGVINPNSGDASVGEFTTVFQYKRAVDVEKPNLLSCQTAKPNLFSEILNVKQKLQQLETQMIQLKSKKQKVGEVKCSPQSGELQHQQDVTESKIIHVTNVHYAARKEVVSMFFSRCGAVKNVTIVTDPVTRHSKGAAFVTFVTMESVNKAIALNGTMFYSRPIKVRRHVIASVTPAPQVVTGS